MPGMVDDVAEKTRSIIDAARARRSGADAEGTGAAASDPAPSPSAASTLPATDAGPEGATVGRSDGTAGGDAVAEPELVPAAIAPVVSTSRRVFSLILLVVIGLAGGIALGTGVLAAITWISDSLLDSFA